MSAAAIVCSPMSDEKDQAKLATAPIPVSIPTAYAMAMPVSIGIPVPVPNDIHHSKLFQDLTEMGFTEGMSKALIENKNHFPIRYWVVDNSGSMMTEDGHRIVETGVTKRSTAFFDCSRWDELRQTVLYHVDLAHNLNAATKFRLLNSPPNKPGGQFFNIATESNTSADVSHARNIMMSTRPTGATPLTEHILDIREEISSYANMLKSEGKRAVVVIATDGVPSDEYGYNSDLTKDQFMKALRSLEGLPVWLVIRLCTDDDNTVEFYNDIDEQLEVSIDVLDDFEGEAKEICEHNSWINYALPIHRMRELGFYDRSFDMIDERSLTKSEIRDYCAILFGEEHLDGIPDPFVDWKGFVSKISDIVHKGKHYWNPLKKKMMPLIDTKLLYRKYGHANCCTIM